MSDPKILAFYLPQFHRIPENDEWWGEGFTEWTNVRKARPQFFRHRQPRVPLSKRYYDLLDPTVHAWQADLARSFGLGGFCYYHYWFNGRQLLEKPLDVVLRHRSLGLPFCLAWANEPWTRTWDGGEHNVLMPQEYGGPQDWERHFRYLQQAFEDPRYIRVDGKPVILIYRSASIVACREMLDCWRTLAVREGFPGLHVASMLTYFADDDRKDLFDAFVEFEPNYTQSRLPFRWKLYEKSSALFNRVPWKLFNTSFRPPRSLDYRVIWDEIARRPLQVGHYAGGFIDWDNSPRKGIESSLIMRHVRVETFGTGIKNLYRKAQVAKSRFIFLNAWNEWAEGTYLEPDEERGFAYLEAIRDAQSTAAPPSR
jgi:lipopolysaccharide biosynthesis protein